ncbi:transposase [Indibacter alkaliphilus]|nr:transposase [Indibacter alkaliphilus]
MELERIYFFTATINSWKPLLYKDHFKLIIIDSWKYLIDKSLMRIYGYVIMPNHIHLIFEMTDLNGKEMPHASFHKYTAHKFLTILRKTNPNFLIQFKVDEANKKHCFWQRDPLDVELYSPSVIYQKLTYIHNNPCRGKWELAQSPLDYKFSSCLFYETGEDPFNILTHIGQRI